MKIVIVGSASFVGKELEQHCRARGIEVVGVDAAPAAGSGHHKMDIRAPGIAELVPEGADAIVHLAAISRDQDCKKDTHLAFDVNVQGTLNVMRAAQARNAKQFIFASSEWVYGNSGTQLVNEETPIDVTKTVSEYGLTKIVGERALAMAVSRGFCASTVLRFGIIYGPRPAPGCPLEGLYNDVRTKDAIELGCSLQSGRRFVHVSDLSDGILAAVGRQGFEIFNLTGNTMITFGDVIEKSAALLGRKPKVTVTKPDALNVRNPDNTKARKVLGWEPRIDLAAGLATLKF